MSWYNTDGYSAAKQEEQRVALGGAPKRYWIKNETSGDFIFVNDTPLTIHEHAPRVIGSFNNEVTCLQNIEEDVACCDLLGVKSRYLAGFYTVVDCSKYVDKKGVNHQYEVKLFPAKQRTLKKLKSKMDQKGSLAGSMYRASRYDPKSPSVGEDFDFQKVVKLSDVFPYANYNGKKLVDMWAKAESDPEAMANLKLLFKVKVLENGKLEASVPEFNYVEILKPLTPKEIRFKFANAKIQTFDNDGPSKTNNNLGADDNVPF